MQAFSLLFLNSRALIIPYFRPFRLNPLRFVVAEYSLIKNYLERNSNKSLTIKIGSEEHTYKGYSMNEIKEIEELFSTSGRDLPDENGSH